MQKGQVAKYQAILGQLLLRDWTVLKVMLTAVVVGSVGVYALVAEGAARLDNWPFAPAAQLLGALLFGIGLAVYGYCPGTGLAGSGERSRDAMVGVLGMVTGAGVFVALYNWVEPAGRGLGEFGKVTVPESLGVSPWLVIALLVAGAVGVFALVERLEGRGRQPSREPRDARPAARGWGWSRRRPA